MKYRLRVIEARDGITTVLQDGVFESSVQLVACQRKTLESGLAENLRPIFKGPKWVNEKVDPKGNNDGENLLRSYKVAFGEGEHHTLLEVTPAGEDAEVTIKSKTTSNAESHEYLIQVVKLDGDDDSEVEMERTVRYASYQGVKYALSKSAELKDFNLSDYSESSWAENPKRYGGGIYRDSNDGNKMITVTQVDTETEEEDQSSE